MYYFSLAAGVIAVFLFMISYQFKKRSHIILVNGISRFFYVLQYILLGAWTGAIIDLLAGVITFVLGNEKLKKVKNVIIGILFAGIIASSIIFYDSLFSLCSFFGVTFEIISLFMKKEKHIRILSMIAQPFWLTYNIYYLAFGSLIGNVITTVSIIISLVRYRNTDKAVDTV